MNLALLCSIVVVTPTLVSQIAEQGLISVQDLVQIQDANTHNLRSSLISNCRELQTILRCWWTNFCSNYEKNENH